MIQIVYIFKCIVINFIYTKISQILLKKKKLLSLENMLESRNDKGGIKMPVHIIV